MEKRKNIIRILVVFILLALIVLGVYLGYLRYNKIEKNEENKQVEQKIKEEPKEEKLKIYNKDGDTRPIAIMLDNNTNAWPHSAVNKAYMIYEMEVEGGESRLMALFKDNQDIEKVGPIRSARHYYLNYVLEHDAMYAHIGASPYARRDIKTLDILDINGQNYDTLRPRNKKNSMEFWRQNGKWRPHDAYTSLENLKTIGKSLNFNVNKKVEPVLNYSVKEVTLPEDNSIKATKIKAGYHKGNMNLFEYDENAKKYTKTAKGILHKDELTKEKFYTKNLVILKAHTTTIDNVGRKDVKNVDTLEGYYITNGRAQKILAKKEGRAKRTKYIVKSTNQEVVFNDGNTYVMVIPGTQNISILDEE